MKHRKTEKERDSFRSWKESPSERRKWERRPPVKGAVALLEGRTYRILDISPGGLAIYNYGEEAIPEETVVSLHATEEGYYVDTLRCRKVSENRTTEHSSKKGHIIRRIALEIKEEDIDLIDRLAPFMLHE